MSNKKKKSDETSSPTRSLTFTAELYPEWNNYINILAYIQKLKYAYIVHDKDTNENGEVKKIHSHVVIKYGGRRTLSSVKNEFNFWETDEHKKLFKKTIAIIPVFTLKI